MVHKKRVLKHRLNERYYFHYQKILNAFLERRLIKGDLDINDIMDSLEYAKEFEHYLIQRMCRY